MSDTDMLYIASLEKHNEMLQHEVLQLKRMLDEIITDVVRFNRTIVRIGNEVTALMEENGELK